MEFSQKMAEFCQKRTFGGNRDVIYRLNNNLILHSVVEKPFDDIEADLRINRTNSCIISA